MTTTKPFIFRWQWFQLKRKSKAGILNNGHSWKEKKLIAFSIFQHQYGYLLILRQANVFWVLTELSKYTYYVVESGCKCPNQCTEGQRVLTGESGAEDNMGMQWPQSPPAHPLSFTPNQPGSRKMAGNYEIGHLGDLLIENKMDCSRLWLWQMLLP